jgi:hypothetical protein
MMRVAGAARDTRALSLNFNMRVVWMACYTGTRFMYYYCYLCELK